MSQNSKKQDKIGKVLIVTAPSGSGKTTIVRHLINHFDQLAFSVSATTRSKRKNEIHGRDYYFIDRETFLKKVENGEFIEWEEVYENQFYGTLKSEVEKLWNEGKIVVFDIEVKGATYLKDLYGVHSLAIFVKVPTMEKLFDRLRNRKTEDEESIKQRMERIKREMAYETRFDIVLYNDHLPQTLQNAEKIVENFIKDSYC